MNHREGKNKSHHYSNIQFVFWNLFNAYFCDAIYNMEMDLDSEYQQLYRTNHFNRYIDIIVIYIGLLFIE